MTSTVFHGRNFVASELLTFTLEFDPENLSQPSLVSTLISILAFGKKNWTPPNFAFKPSEEPQWSHLVSKVTVWCAPEGAD